MMNINIGINPTFSRHGIAQVNLALLIWLNENVGFLAIEDDVAEFVNLYFECKYT